MKSPGTGAMLYFIGHALMENRYGLMGWCQTNSNSSQQGQ
jgi:hypothetical protein